MKRRNKLSALRALAACLIFLLLWPVTAQASSYLYWRTASVPGDANTCAARAEAAFRRKPLSKIHVYDYEVWGSDSDGSYVRVICLSQPGTTTALTFAASDRQVSALSDATGLSAAIADPAAPLHPTPAGSSQTIVFWGIAEIAGRDFDACYSYFAGSLRQRDYSRIGRNATEVSGVSPVGNYLAVTCIPFSKDAMMSVTMAVGPVFETVKSDVAAVIAAIPHHDAKTPIHELPAFDLSMLVPKSKTSPFPHDARPVPAECSALKLGPPANATAITDYQSQLAAFSDAAGNGSIARGDLYSWMNTHPDPEEAIGKTLSEPELGKDGLSDARKAELLHGYLERQGEYLASVWVTWGVRDRRSFAALDQRFNVLQSANMTLGDDTYLRGAVAVEMCKAGLLSDSKAGFEIIDVQNDLARLYEDRRRYEDAEPYLRNALKAAQSDANSQEIKNASEQLGINLFEQKRWAQAEPLLRAAGRIVELAKALAAQGKYKDAESVLRALMKDNSNSDWLSKPLSTALAGQGRYAEAADTLRPALENERKAMAPETGQVTYTTSPWLTQSSALAALGRWEFLSGQPQKGAADFAMACEGVAFKSLVGDNPGDTEITADMDFPAISAVGCNRELLSLLWHAKGFSRDDRLKAAFVAGQEADFNSVNAAIARSTARLLAERAGAGELLAHIEKLHAHEIALSKKYNIDEVIRQEQLHMGDPATQKRYADTITKYAAEGASDGPAIESDMKQLVARVPNYADTRTPPPVSLRELGKQTAQAKALLGEGEVLIQTFVPPGKEHGFVFAATREKADWSEIALSGDEIADLVQTLRAEIDPNAYGITTQRSEIFSRDKSFALYRALFGAPQIASIFRDASKKTVIFIPSGPLASFPLGLMVIDKPQQASGPMDQIMRHAAWLLRDKAVAVVPSLSALKALRKPRAGKDAEAAAGFLAFADPDFGAHLDDTCRNDVHRGPPKIDALRHDGAIDIVALRAALAQIPLPCTHKEAEQIRTRLGGTVLFGPQATESEIRKLDSDGTLFHTRVLALMTHGLITGDFGLTEPALVLSLNGQRGTSPENDGVLTASEIATLHLDADWVILSACNTAAPQGPGADGLSGLARAFFYAGAHALLVSNWSVNDAEASSLVPQTVAPQQNGLSRAQALQKASLDILDNHSANPADWGVFTLVGEPD